MTRFWRFALSGLAIAALVGCAGPPLTLYTLTDGGTPAAATTLARAPVIVSVARVTIPDSLDSTDIVIRDGAILRRSAKARWASRLSVAMTDLLTAELAARLSDAVVTDQPQAAPVSARLIVDIPRFDITSAGNAVLDANWTIVPADAATPIARGRAQVTDAGKVDSDQDVVALVRTSIIRLAAAIDLPALASAPRAP